MTSIFFSKWHNCLCRGVNTISHNEHTSSRQTAMTATTLFPTTVLIFIINNNHAYEEIYNYFDDK